MERHPAGHVHALIAFKNTENKSIDTIVGNGKRFMAYEIIKRLKEKLETSILEKLGEMVTISDRKKGKLHEVLLHHSIGRSVFLINLQKQNSTISTIIRVVANGI